jgi:hypothetical protein
MTAAYPGTPPVVPDALAQLLNFSPVSSLSPRTPVARGGGVAPGYKNRRVQT